MLSCQKHLFSLPEDLIYLNCAYMSPLLRSVEDAGIRGLREKRNPSRVTPDDFFTPLQQVRDSFAQLVDAPEAERICLIPSASYGMGIVARNLPIKKGDSIICAGEQFPSNVYPWLSLQEQQGIKVHCVPPPDVAEHYGRTWNQRILEAITPETRMVAIGHIHWADGTRFDLKALRERTREVDALLVIDGTQSVGALPFSVREIQPDALIVAGYKTLMGPYSIGCAYLGPVFEQGIPLEENWKNRKNSHVFSQLVNYQPEYQPGSMRFDVGESSNFILVPMLLEALKQLNQWQPTRVQAYCQQINEKPLQELQSLGWKVQASSERAENLFGIRPPKGLDLNQLKEELAAAHIFVSVRGTAIRVSPHVYNTVEDLYKLVEVCAKLSQKAFH